MLPHNHFIIADLAITAAAAIHYPQIPAFELGKWILAGGSASAAIDLDIITLVLLKSKKDGRLKPYKNPLKVFADFKPFMKTIAETGLLKTGMATHLIISAATCLFFYFYCHAYFIPILIGIITHLLEDTPHMRYLKA